MKERNKRDNKTKYLLILLLLIAVGYAAIATTLKINGTSSIKSARWDVYWENPQVIDGSITNAAPTLSENDTKATFNVTLNEPGDYYEFTIDAVNNGSLDAKIDTDGIVKQVKNSSGQVVNPTILKYEVTNNDQGHTALEEGHILAKKSGNTPTKETYRVRVEYRNDSGINPSDLDDNDLVFTIEFSVKYVQGPKVEPAIHYITRQNDGQITIGDVIGIGETEEFYVISSNSEKTVLQGKYNLLVGGEIKNYRYSELIPEDIPRYGLQSAEATIGTDGNYKYVVRFSDDAYWMNGTNLISPYNENDTIYYNDPDIQFKYRLDDSQVYPYIYDANSTVYQYISGENGYVDKLKNMGAPSSITGRIITYQEAKNVESINYNILYSHKASYWIATPYGINGIYYIAPELGTIDTTGPSNINGYGVRPVIEIPTSELN